MRVATLPRLVSSLAFVAVAGACIASCSLGDGSGSVVGVLDEPNCWEGAFDLQPTFFAANPYTPTSTQASLELRIQNGSDLEAFSDGVEILIDDPNTIRGSASQASLYGDPLIVSLPVGVAAPGVPISANANPSTVHFTLYLDKTCQTEDVALYALESVSLNSDGTCSPPDGGGALQIACPGSSLGLADAGAVDGAAASSSDAGGDAGATSEAGVGAGVSTTTDGGTSNPPVGHSTMTFTSLFDGDPAEVSAAERLNQGTFDVYLADPREACPGGLGPPPPCRGHLTGNFKFYFQRGRPAQPFQ